MAFLDMGTMMPMLGQTHGFLRMGMPASGSFLTMD